MGIILAGFIILQATSGALLSLEGFLAASGWEQEAATASPPAAGSWQWELWLAKIHFGGGLPAKIYRFLLGLGLMGMATSGTLIFIKIRARTRKT
jgi:uncharacterized iron-regulated membrane protein